MIRFSRVFSLVLILSFVSCASKKEMKPIDEKVVFDFEESSTPEQELGDLDFDNENLEEELSFEEEPLKEKKVLEEPAPSFEDFDEPQVSTLEPPASENLSASEETLEFEEPLSLESSENEFEDLSLEEDVSFTSPLETEAFQAQDADKVEITSIDYNSNQNGGAFFIKASAKLMSETEYIPETNQYIVTLRNAKISKSLARPFLTKDFKQSFESMSSYQAQDGSAKLVFNLKKGSAPRVQSLPNGIVVEPGISGPPPEELVGYQDGVDVQKLALSATDVEDFLLNKNKFVGKKISIQAKDESVVNVINFISEQVGANLVVSDSVKGNISIKLKEVPWDQALVVIMKAKSLGYVRNGNILRVAPLEALKKESLDAAAVKNAKRTLEPFFVKVFPLSYAKPEVVEQKVRPFLTPEQDGGVSGQVLSEQRSSSVIVRDSLDVIRNIAALIKELDRPPLQVMIQAKVVEASKNFTKNMESIFNITPSTEANGGNFRADSNIVFGRESNTTVGSFRPSVNLSGLNFLGTLNQQLRINEIDSKVRVLSSPSIMALNNEKAVILQQDEVLTRSIVSDVAGNTNINIIRNPVELRLEVTPQVSSDGNVIMELIVKRQFPGTEQNGELPISSREAETKVIVGNNKTAMIGGVYQVLENKSNSGTPVLRKLPLLKWLFGNRNYQKINTELVIFMTPTIINKFSHKPVAKGIGLDDEDARQAKSL